MQDSNKRKSKLVGMNDNKLDAIKNLRDARAGGNRLDQALKVTV